MIRNKLRTAFFISGSGTTLYEILQAHKKGGLPVIEPVAVLTSTYRAAGIEKAQRFGIPTYIVERNQYKNTTEFGKALKSILMKQHVNFISQNGWLPLTPTSIVNSYRGNIVNQHPGPLDPGRLDFGGKGMYGSRVMCALLAYRALTGENTSAEATTHHVTEEFDRGAVIRATAMELGPVKKTHSITELQQTASQLKQQTRQYQSQLLAIEWQTVIETLRDFRKSTAPIVKREKPLIPKKYSKHLAQAKQLAQQLFPDG